MTEHLPECPWTTECPATGPHEFIPNQVGQIWCYKCTSTECQCEILRACEERMLNDDIPAAAYHGQKGYEIGYSAGLDAAREVVVSVGTGSGYIITRNLTLAAIDALRDKP